MKLHVETCHDQNIAEFECEFCPFKSNHIRELKVHKITHNFNFTCEQCNFKSTSEFAFNLHHEEKHRYTSAPASQTFPCPQCGLTFAAINDLKLHTDMSHTAFQTFPCPQCGLTFAAINDLNLHTDMIHTHTEAEIPTMYNEPSDVRDDNVWVKQQLGRRLTQQSD